MVRPDELSLAWNPAAGAVVGAARAAHAVSRAELGELLDVSGESVRRWENGSSRPSPAAVARLVDLLRLDEADLERAVVKRAPATLGDRLRRARSAAGLTQAEVAERVGVAQETYAGWERNRSRPAAGQVRPLARALQVDRQDLAVAVDAARPVEQPRDRWVGVGAVIGRRRVALGWSREELGAAVGMSARAVAEWETGVRQPSPMLLAALARVLEVPLSQLTRHHRFSRGRPQPVVSNGFARFVDRRRVELGLSLEEVAVSAGLSRTTVSRWLHGRHAPTSGSLVKLAAALSVPAGRLLAFGVHVDAG